ncbi:hypothetical protein LAZ67_23001454 [Cordylochernes scorpioides]|uniref:Reverse transcriptase domain-containing protein n=1 Tax=Cordylochernes scorpioides TaxID=51811 RepID=A0ABY6LT89_9ARAC|nr:hypothetical protein LAZ67_23001454 [Cordylochernes scorpioides]
MEREVAIDPFVSHISKFPVHGYRSGSGLVTPYYRAVPYLCCFSRPPSSGGLLGRSKSAVGNPKNQLGVQQQQQNSFIRASCPVRILRGVTDNINHKRAGENIVFTVKHNTTMLASRGDESTPGPPLCTGGYPQVRCKIAGLLELSIGTCIIMAGILELGIKILSSWQGLLELSIGTCIIIAGIMEMGIRTFIIMARALGTENRDFYRHDDTQVLCWNVNGLERMLLQFDLFTHLEKCSIFALTETWKDQHLKNKPTGFHLYESLAQRDHKKGRSSGEIIVVIRETIKDKIERTEIEKQWIMICLRLDGEMRVCMIFAYLPPNEHYLTNCKNLLDQIERKIVEGYEVLLAGDLNTRTGAMGILHNTLYLPCYLTTRRTSKDPVISTHSEQFIDRLDNNTLTILNGRTRGDRCGNYTYISARGSSVVDYCIVSHGLLGYVHDLYIEGLPHSDHLPLIIKMDMSWGPKQVTSPTSRLASEKETIHRAISDWQQFYNKLLDTEPIPDYEPVTMTLLNTDNELTKCITLNEISKEISRIRHGKATGFDDIMNEAIKALPKDYLTSLKDIFNRILRTSEFPTTWLKSVIQPIFKNGDPDDPSNYQGIALLSNIAKLFTSILKSRLGSWIKKRNIVPENQAGFRAGHSCQDHIFTLSSLIQMTLSRKRRKCYMFFVDLKKAFDTVPHSLLWRKLVDAGLNHRFVNLIKDYYTNMTTVVRWNNSFTAPIKVASHYKGKSLAAIGAVWQVLTKSKMNSLNAAMRLLDSTVLPHMLYAAPCWALNQVKVVDQVQNIFLRGYLNLPKYTPGFMLRMECGRVSQEVIITKQVLRFWVRIMKMEELKRFSFLKGCPDYTAILTEIPAIIRKATEQSIQNDMAKILNTSHYSHFKYLKNSITAERYLFTTIPLATKRFFAQLRLLWTIFPENRSKRWKIDLTLTCDLCKNRIQDEIIHIIFGCSCLEKQRKEILGDLPWSQPDCQQICSWMNTLMVDQGLSLGLYKFYKAAVNVRWRIMDSPNVVVCLEEESED